ncbi:hypothetical protein HY970_00695 [Candidatus Kaiserbacteria bacterium]|nr:hypothetical protein [Candidatus Kaiserbacteria bacterium]
MTTLSPQEIGAIYEKANALMVAGKSEDARAYLMEQLPQLPEDLRNKIVVELLNEAVQEELHELQTIDDIQEEGMAAAELLEELKKKKEKEATT